LSRAPKQQDKERKTGARSSSVCVWPLFFLSYFAYNHTSPNSYRRGGSPALALPSFLFAPVVVVLVVVEATTTDVDVADDDDGAASGGGGGVRTLDTVGGTMMYGNSPSPNVSNGSDRADFDVSSAASNSCGSAGGGGGGADADRDEVAVVVVVAAADFRFLLPLVPDPVAAVSSDACEAARDLPDLAELDVEEDDGVSTSIGPAPLRDDDDDDEAFGAASPSFLTIILPPPLLGVTDSRPAAWCKVWM